MRRLLTLWRDLRRAGRRERAAELLSRADALARGGDHAGAEACCERAVAADPDLGEAWLLLAALRGRRPHREGARAAVAHAAALLIDGTGPPAPGQLEAAAAVAIAVDDSASAAKLIAHVDPPTPGVAALWMRLGATRVAAGDLEGAAEAYERAAAMAPDDHAAANELGRVRLARGDPEGAIACFEQTVRLAPGFHGGHANLGNALFALGRLGPATDAFREALRLAPGDPDTLNNLATALKDGGEVETGILCYREAIERAPDFAQAHSNLLFAMQYSLRVTPAERFDAHREWARRHGRGGAAAAAPPRAAGSRLRIGYVSPDLGEHPIGRFLAPVLAAHDRSEFDVVCYDDSHRTDRLNARLRGLGHRWRRCAAESDGALAATIAGDRIDILVDLTGHTARNRLRVFSSRAAPVQASWIGYLHSTGIDAIDYLVADEVAVPRDTRERFTEQPLRLAGSFLCYGLPDDAPPVREADPGGPVTFGCFNNLAKLNAEVLAAWAAILERTPGARLRLKNGALGDPATAERVRERLRSAGIGTDRVELRGGSPREGYLEAYRGVDVALDPWPFSGGTVTCDALWMGVPVVTFAGPCMAGRTSASVLHALGLKALVAESAAGYVETALELAADRERRRALRRSMRARFADSTLGDAQAFTRGLEDAFREIGHRRDAPGDTATDRT